MPKSIRFDGVVKAGDHYHIKHAEGEEIVQCENDAEFVQWCRSRVVETTQTALATFLAAALRTSNGDLTPLEQHRGKTITLDLGGDMTSTRSHLRVK